jgi:ABC-type antimicrobial peptide transport system permease subunit
MQTPLIAGRTFSDVGSGERNEAVVSEEFARRAWPGGNAIGKMLVLGKQIASNRDRHGEARADSGRGPQLLTVVGVVRSVRVATTIGDKFDVYDRPEVYISSNRAPYLSGSLIVRSHLPITEVKAAISHAITDQGRSLPVGVRPRIETTQRDEAPSRTLAEGISAIALFSAWLALVGLYGMAAFTLRSRTREIGIRLALGASPYEATRTLLRDGTRLVLGGVALGLILGLFVIKVMTGFLLGAVATNAAALVVTAFVFAIVGMAAIYLPARRSARIDPIVALRS